MIKMDEAVNLLVGNPITDSEHLELILLINLIYTYSNSKAYKTAVPGLVVLFTTKLLSHCKSEEAQLITAGCTSIYEHIKEHERIIATTVPMLDNITLDTVKTFEQILTKHIREYDMLGFCQ